MRITVLHLNRLTTEERDRLNGRDGGWDSEPKFSRYANITMLAKEDDVREAFKNGEYDIVADMEVTALEDGFHKSNNIEAGRCWLTNDEVTSTSETEARSTSVGDIFADPDTGNYFIVKPCGFEQISL